MFFKNRELVFYWGFGLGRIIVEIVDKTIESLVVLRTTFGQIAFVSKRRLCRSNNLV